MAVANFELRRSTNAATAFCASASRCSSTPTRTRSRKPSAGATAIRRRRHIDTPNRKLNAPPLDFDGGHRRSLTLNLFFDVTEPVKGKRIGDVRKLTNPVAALARIERTLDHPPIVRIAWGHAPRGSDFPFTGVMTSLTQNFTLFSDEGKPLRADLAATFVEFLSPTWTAARPTPS